MAHIAPFADIPSAKGARSAYDRDRPPHLREQAGGMADCEGVDVSKRIRTCPDVAKWRARILANSTISPDGCWEWGGPTDRYGYGKFNFRDPSVRMTGAHRAAWLAFEGDIPGDLVIDHLCRNRACVNTLHMELVTNSTNVLRGDHSAKAGRSGAGSKRGARLVPGQHSCGVHGRDDGYEKVGHDGYVRWVCRPCTRERNARNKARRAAAA